MLGRETKKLETIVGKDSEFRGEVSVAGTVRIDGALEGDVRADWVVVGETGRIRGNIRSKGMVTGGRIEGNIDASEIAELKPGSNVCGEIRTVKLVISEGAIFDGNCRMSGREQDAEPDGEIVFINAPSHPS
jgi:cytoskeletal protein CcmA (bactofilin family)